MYDYKGPKDPNRLHNQEISPFELKLHMQLVTSVPMDDIFLEVAVEPYHRGNPPREESMAFFFTLSVRSPLAILADLLFLPCAQTFKAFASKPPQPYRGASVAWVALESHPPLRGAPMR